MKKTLLSIAMMMGAFTAAHADNERLVLTYADGEHIAVTLSYLKALGYSHEDMQGHEGYGYLSMLASMKSGAVNRISLEDLVSVDFLADFKNVMGITYYEVQRQHGENAQVVMLNCINNNFGDGFAITDQRDTDWTGQRYGERGFFLIDTPKGFDSTFTITGLDTGRRYNATWLLQNDSENPCGQSCWAFTMPKEPIRIVASATEETVYEGYDWLGTYAGYPLFPAADLVYKTLKPTAQLDIKGNATYLFASSTPQSISAFGEYTYDFDKYTMKYVPKPDDADLTAPTGYDEYAATVQFIPSPFAPNADERPLGLVRVNNLTHDTPDNNRRFIIFKGDGSEYTYFCAAKDDYNGRATQYLVELQRLPQDEFTCLPETAWIHFTDYGAHYSFATLDFQEGSSITDACTAVVSYFDEVEDKYVTQFKYVAEADGKNPQFLPLDPEPGPDGPGEAADWTGPKTFYAKAYGQVDGGALAENSNITVLLDQNYNGSSNPSHAVIKANAGRYEIVGSGGDYKYFPAEKKIVIYHVLMGYDMGWQTDYYDVELHVGDDLQTLTIDGIDGYLYGSRTNTCIKVGPDCILKAQ